MRTNFLLLLTALGILLIGCNPQKKEENHGQQESTGILRPQSRYFDFGKVSISQKDSVDFIFSLKNFSKENIVLGKVEPSCSCISITNIPDTILPNATVPIKGRIGIKQSVGKFNKPIFVNYQDEVLLLRIVGNITK